MDTSPIDGIEKRTQRYWYVDGLSELAAGVLFLLLGAYFFLVDRAPADSFLAKFNAFGVPVLALIVAVGGRFAVSAVKRRLTYPRTGYVAYRQESFRRRGISTLIAGCIAATTVVLMTTFLPPSVSWLPAVIGIAIGAASIGLGHRIGLTRFYVLGLISIILGLVVARAGGSESHLGMIYFGGVGLALSFQGMLTFALYLHKTRPLTEETDGS